MTSCVDADVDDNIAFPVGTVICSRASTTTVPTIETSADSFEQVTTPAEILGEWVAFSNILSHISVTVVTHHTPHNGVRYVTHIRYIEETIENTHHP